MLWVKAFHIIAMVTWFAGLFYLPRLYVYHAMTTDDISNQRFKVMERKLYYGIMWPGAVLTLLTGGWLLHFKPENYVQGHSFLCKLSLVFLTIIYHFYCGQLRKIFAQDKNTHNHVFYRWINEIPTIFLIAIVILVVVKPFH